MNPFVIAGEIPSEYFCDRQKETKKITELVVGGANVCIVAQRRMGKSQLIKHIFHQECMKKYHLVYVDLLYTHNIQELAVALSQAIFNTIRTRGEKVWTGFLSVLQNIRPQLSLDPLTGLPQIALETGRIVQAETDLAKLFAYLEQVDKPCIVAFDEFQRITEYPEKDIETLLRSYIQHLSNVHFIYSGSQRHIISEMFVNSSRPFYSSTEMMVLQPIPEAVYFDFASHWFEQAGITIEKDALGKFYQYGQGNTAFLQRLCHFAYAKARCGEHIDFHFLLDNVLNLLEDSSEIYRLMLEQLNTSQRDLLYAIAQEGKVTSIMGGSFIRAHGLQSASSVQSALKKLLQLDLITKCDNAYQLSDNLLRLHLWILSGGSPAELIIAQTSDKA